MNHLQRASAVLVCTALLVAGIRAGEKPPADRPTPIASIQDLMQIFVDPAADALWDSVSTTTTLAGVDEKRPVTAAEWGEQRRHALSLIEGANLLLLPGRHVAVSGGALEDAQLAAVLSAPAIEARIAADPGRFAERALALRVAASQALEAIQARDAARLLRAGSALDQACERCHLLYWYPNGGPPAAPRAAAPPG